MKWVFTEPERAIGLRGFCAKVYFSGRTSAEGWYWTWVASASALLGNVATLEFEQPRHFPVLTSVVLNSFESRIQPSLGLGSKVAFEAAIAPQL